MGAGVDVGVGVSAGAGMPGVLIAIPSCFPFLELGGPHHELWLGQALLTPTFMDDLWVSPPMTGFTERILSTIVP